MKQYSVTIMPENLTVHVPKGTNLLTAAAKAGVSIESPCGGNGTCGKCAVEILEGEFEAQHHMHLTPELKEMGYSLACQIKVNSDLVVNIPKHSRLTKHQVVLEGTKFNTNPYGQDNAEMQHMPILQKVVVKLESSSLDDNINDLDRLKRALYKKTGLSDITINLDCLRKLPILVRESDWELTTYIFNAKGIKEIIDIEAGNVKMPAYGMSVDIGTTTVVVNLINTETSEIVDKVGSYNKQSIYGADVISRIIHADENADGIEMMQEAVLESINELIDEILKRNKLDCKDIKAMVCAGNTVMTHFLMKVPATYLRLDPYIPAAVSFPGIRAREIHLNVNPNAYVLTVPSVASYVGGDITAGVLSTGLAHSDKLTLFIDVGTNGELVIGNKEWLVTCSCSAGPAFEGSGISSGMRAMDGAIDYIKIDKQSFEVECRTIGGTKPIGICGSGLIYSISEMMEAGLMDRAGKLLQKACRRLRQGTEGLEYILVFAEESGSGQDIVVTEADIKNILRAKGAIFAGIRTMLQMVQLDVSSIERVLIAGGFGNYINIEDAINIGFLPDLPIDRFEYVGNSSVQGASMMLLNGQAVDEAETIAAGMTYIELSVGNLFMDEFISAVFIPHTDLTLFPSVRKE